MNRKMREMKIKLIHFLARLLNVEEIPFSEAIVTDEDGGVIAVISMTSVIWSDGYKVILR